MLIVDTHVHVGKSWYEPIETLIFQMEQNKIDKAVLIQYRGNYNNEYEIECIKEYPGRFAAVVIVDTKQTDAPEKLEMWVNKGATGVRLMADERSPDSDQLNIWRKAEELGMTVSCGGKLEDFASDEFRSLVQELSNLKIVIEHLGAIATKSKLDSGLFQRVLELAYYPNTYIKLPGFGELFSRPMPFREPPFVGTPEAVRMAYDAFGAKRMMWGSDFPPSASREGYANTLHFPMKKTDFFTEEDKAWIFGKTAMSVWKFV